MKPGEAAASPGKRSPQRKFKSYGSSTRNCSPPQPSGGSPPSSPHPVKVSVTAAVLSEKRDHILKIDGDRILLHPNPSTHGPTNPGPPTRRSSHSPSSPSHVGVHDVTHLRSPVKAREKSFDPKVYNFDDVYVDSDEHKLQRILLRSIGLPASSLSSKGFNTAILVYGLRTTILLGAKKPKRKSFSQQHHNSTVRGIVHGCCDDLLQRLGSPDQPQRYAMDVRFYQIKENRINCMLDSTKTGLRVREHPELGPYIEGITVYSIKTMTGMQRVLESVTPAPLNSHAVLDIQISSHSGKGSQTVRTPFSRLTFVDLAEPERGAAGVVNHSLVTLKNLINSLNPTHHTAMGFTQRDSTLTWLLKDPLSAATQTSFVAVMKNSASHYEATSSVLKYCSQLSGFNATRESGKSRVRSASASPAPQYGFCGPVISVGKSSTQMARSSTPEVTREVEKRQSPPPPSRKDIGSVVVSHSQADWQRMLREKEFISRELEKTKRELEIEKQRAETLERRSLTPVPTPVGIGTPERDHVPISRPRTPEMKYGGSPPSSRPTKKTRGQVLFEELEKRLGTPSRTPSRTPSPAATPPVSRRTPSPSPIPFGAGYCEDDINDVTTKNTSEAVAISEFNRRRIDREYRAMLLSPDKCSQEDTVPRSTPRKIWFQHSARKIEYDAVEEEY
eukprot:TRINITY_DN15474_c0_g1_i1.p1 TRINITY_DN15474_c0_g1~~TRINITY_DN15474_c0_g1_i1.p1  ORF type:complete len:674 (+),score=105.61 TRINITY_DN15474_c0_g1_i1:66-2087(+)